MLLVNLEDFAWKKTLLKKSKREWLILSLLLWDMLKKRLFFGEKNVEEEPKTQEDKMIKDKLKQNSVEALKKHDSVLVGILRYLISLIDKKELQLPPGEMKESDEIAVLQKELKNKEESKAVFQKADRNDLVSSLDYEIEVLKSYLPKQMNETEISKMVNEAIQVNGNNFPLVMKEVMGKVAGRASGDVVSKIVKQKLSV